METEEIDPEDSIYMTVTVLEPFTFTGLPEIDPIEWFADANENG